MEKRSPAADRHIKSDLRTDAQGASGVGITTVGDGTTAVGGPPGVGGRGITAVGVTATVGVGITAVGVTTTVGKTVVGVGITTVGVGAATVGVTATVGVGITAVGVTTTVGKTIVGVGITTVGVGTATVGVAVGHQQPPPGFGGDMAATKTTAKMAANNANNALSFLIRNLPFTDSLLSPKPYSLCSGV